MSDFFSDSDGEKAVEELLSQAMDSTILEQVAAINCAGFTDSGLPSQLETRFQRLKSFPSPKSASLSTKSFNLPHDGPELKKTDSINEAKNPDFGEENDAHHLFERMPTTCWTKCPEEKNSSCDGGDSSFSPYLSRKMEKKGRKKSPSSISRSSCEGFSSRSVSPPVKTGCFLCSPKKVSSKKKNRGNKGLNLGINWGKNDEFLSDLSNFSMNNSQRKMVKKAMEEEQKICEEAEKIVKWAKQASARMDVSGIEDEISDDDAKFQ